VPVDLGRLFAAAQRGQGGVDDEMDAGRGAAFPGAQQQVAVDLGAQLPDGPVVPPSWSWRAQESIAAWQAAASAIGRSVTRRAMPSSVGYQRTSAVARARACRRARAAASRRSMR
jgi:hypothetical protein